MGPDPPDPWAGGEAYERFMGRWSLAAARAFVPWLALPPGGRWLDVGCGTGALVRAVLDVGAPASVVGVEPSGPLLDVARVRVRDPRARFVPGSADALPLADGAVDATASSFVLNFVPDPAAALREMARATRPGGTVAATVWDYGDGMAFLRAFWDVAAELDPNARRLDEGVRFPLCRPEPLTSLFVGAGLDGVRVEALEVPTRFASFADLWEPFLGGTGPAPGYLASLAEPRRGALRDRLAARLPRGSDGAIDLRARAWAVAGAVSATTPTGPGRRRPRSPGTGRSRR